MAMGPMSATTETNFGLVTPVLSYAMACVGSALGLRCTVRALAAEGRVKRNWLITAAAALGTGIWTMHFVAMLGFAVVGTDIRYAVVPTVASLTVAIVVTGAGSFIVGYGPSRGPALLAGGVVTGIGVAAMHYLGMAGLRLDGTIHYDTSTVALSVVIGIAAATAAFWAALTVRLPLASLGAALIMAVAVSAMHYTGMQAAVVQVRAGGGPVSGATAMDFIFPMVVVLGSALFLSSAFVALSPTSPHPLPDLDAADSAASTAG
jgi:NO-binding membrane sensor protein with MHYT domain